MFKYNIFFIITLFSIKSLALNVDRTIESTIQNNPKVKIALEKLIESKPSILLRFQNINSSQLSGSLESHL